jgi:CRP/FNR family transcriptional regulator
MEARKEREQMLRMLRQTDVFQNLTDNELANILTIGEPKRFRAGDLLVREGARADRLFVIEKGQARLSAKSRGEQFTIRIAQNHESLPLACLLDPPIAVTTMEAVTELETLSLPRDKLMALCEAQPLLGLHLYRAVASMMARRYRMTLAQLTDVIDATFSTMAVS